MAAKKIHNNCKYAAGILIGTLVLGCATAPPTQEMSDARQSLEAAENMGAEKHAPHDLDNAQYLLSKAQNDIQAGEFKHAQKEALAAREAARKAFTISQSKQTQDIEPASPETISEAPVVVEPPAPILRTTYTVKQDDNLWTIAAKTHAYADPLLWPLIFKNNAESISNPDLIFPDQILTIETAPSDADKIAARQFAKQRGISMREDKDAAYLHQYGLR